MAKLRGSAWWQLLRAGNVFTAISNVAVGFLLVRGEWQPFLPLLLLLLSSAALYLSGMVLNDVFDLERDRIERPERPLPSGRINLAQAKFVGWGLMICGFLMSGIVAWLLESRLPAVTAILLALSIIGYDALLKSTPFGPVAMGLCRSLNALLGASVVAHSADKYSAYVYAIALGIYTVGLTLFARNEASETTPRAIKFAANVIQLALIVLLAIVVFETLPKYGWYALWLAVVFAVRVVAYEAYLGLTPVAVQKSVSRLITMFIPLDALVAVAAAGWMAGLVVLVLLIPTYVATRRVAMT